MSESGASAAFPIVISLLVIIGTLVLNLVVRQILFLRTLPPGPWGLPFIGSMRHLMKNNIFGEFEKYRKQYGDIFSVGIGEFNVVVLNGHKLIHEAFKKDEFLGRPDFDGWAFRNLGVKNRGILFCDGNNTWNEQRRFALRNLRDFGFGKESMEGLLLSELSELINLAKKNVDKPIELKNIFNSSVLNSLWYILSGRRFDIQDPVFRRIISLLTTNVKEAHLAGPAFFYNWPVRYNLVAKGKMKRFETNRNEIQGLIQEEIDRHLETFEESNSRDFIDVYLQQSNQSEVGSSFNGEEGRKNLLITLHDLFVAGAETTSTTLLWAMLFLARDTKIQDKLFAEIDSVIGKNQPSRDNKPNMPYTEAVLNEVHRCGSLVPFSVFHKVVDDTEIQGHYLPKDTVIFANIYGSHHDKEFWKDPENFRPERFLDSTGTKVVKQEALMPFSTGKRTCLGETLARDTLFLFLTGIVQQFSFELVPDSTDFDPKALPKTCSFILQPEPYQIILKNRV